jgi:hypothetical protein
MKHADTTPAPTHFAGALLVRNDGTNIYRRLTGLKVTVGTGANPAAPRDNLLTELPSLRPAVSNPNFTLELLTNREDRRRIATRFMLYGGEMRPENPALNDWQIDASKHGTKVGPHTFSLGAVWTPLAGTTTVTLEVTRLDGTAREDPIVLGSGLTECTEVYFYNYDSGLPTVDELNEPEGSDPDFVVDHDFKWVYRLFDPPTTGPKPWKKWLGRDKFPTLRRTNPPNPGLGPLLIPVMTCYSTIWADE